MSSPCPPSLGVILADYGTSWREHRRFALMTLRNFGLGKQSMEGRIHGELQYVMDTLENSIGGVECVSVSPHVNLNPFRFRHPSIWTELCYFMSFTGKNFSPQLMFHNASSNIICQVLFGKRYDYNDEFIKVIVSCFTENAKLANGPWAMVSQSRFVNL